MATTLSNIFSPPPLSFFVSPPLSPSLPPSSFFTPFLSFSLLLHVYISSFPLLSINSLPSHVSILLPSSIFLPGDGTMSFAEFLELMADVMSQSTRWGNLATKLNGYVGFDTIQEQIRKKSLKRGFELNLMVVG